MIAILDWVAATIHTLIYSLPAGWLPFIEVTLTVVTGICMLLTLLFFLRLNNWIAGVICLVLSSCLWLLSPSVIDEVHQRQLGMAVISSGGSAVAPAVEAGGTDAPQPAGKTH